MALRFHLDESVHLAVASGLRYRGIEVTTPQETDLLCAADERHLGYARGQGRVLMTHDPDFLRLHAAGFQHSGIAFAHNQSRSVGQIVRALEHLSLNLEPDEMFNRVVFL